MKKKCTAIVLAAGSGKRMKSDVAKQFMMINDRPLIWYALQAVEQSEVLDDCVLVTGSEDMEYMQTEIVDKYGFRKVSRIVAGGAERFHSVINGLHVLDRDTDYVYIHDGARPFLTEGMIAALYEGVEQYHACVAAVQSKDTVKISDASGFVQSTPDRSHVWLIQTPQVFDAKLICEAYTMLERKLAQGEDDCYVTDDASVVELLSDVPVKMVEGDYRNRKVTTPEDIDIMACLLR